MSGTRPIIVQGNGNPVFVGRGQETLRCTHCNHVLAESVEQNCLVSLDIECYACGNVTRTPDWPFDTPLPRRSVTMGTTGRFLVKGPVEMPQPVCFTCDEEISRVAALFGARPVTTPTGLSLDDLTSFVAKLDVITDSKLSRALGQARRARSAGNRRFLRSELAWAVDRLQQALAIGELELEGDDGIALNFLQLASHLIKTWEHHPVFPVLASELVIQFHHTATTLMVASYLADHGNAIGITHAAAQQGKSADLFIMLNDTSSVPIEIKAPPALQWPTEATSYEQTIEAQLRRARDQITGEQGGVVVVGSSHGRIESLSAAIESLTTRGRVSSRIVAVVAVSYGAAGDFRLSQTGMLDTNFAARMVPIRNPRFAGRAEILNT